MTAELTLSPLTRIEGHLSVRMETESIKVDGLELHRVREARCEGEMYRGIEKILVGRDPLDAQQITQRVCGVCPISHATASVRAQEMAYGIKPCHNGLLLQNLILAANYLQSHILHFYALAALDFVDVASILSYEGNDRTLKAVKSWVEQAMVAKDSFAGAPLLPRFDGDFVKDANRNAALLAHYIEALDMRRLCHEMAAVFGARLPHSTSIFPGGVTESVTPERVLAYRSRLAKAAEFVESVLIPDLLQVAAEFPGYFDIGRGYGNYLCYGGFPHSAGGGGLFIDSGVLLDGKWDRLDPGGIAEDLSHARYAEAAPQSPASAAASVPAPHRPGAYSWVKAPRYRGEPMEVGPLARVMANYSRPGGSWVKNEVDALLNSLKLPAEKLNSVLGRHVARGLEARWVARQASAWLDELEFGAPSTTPFEIPESGAGMGLMEAPRGALGHWIRIEKHRIAAYQCVVPTTWNCSPRDTQKRPGPVEKSLEGLLVKDPAQPIEVGRVVRSFDPCLACAIH